MQNNEYYLKALQKGLYKMRDWVLSVFSVTEYPIYEDTGNHKLYHMQLVKSKNDPSRLYWFDEDNPETPIELTDYLVDRPLFTYKDRILLNPGDLENVVKQTDTNYGNCLFNCVALIYPFGSKIEFITGRVKGSSIENQIAANLHDTPPEGTERDPTKFYVDELINHADAVTSLEAFNLTCVPTTSESTMLPNPRVIKRRDELLKQYKDELHKPAIIAKIQSELAALDKEFFKDDRASGFYISGKAFNIVRMKKFIMLGLIGGFGGEKPELVTSSLAEGWERKSLPSLIDDIRAGSYARGKSTAIAGAGVKLVYNAFQTVTITEDDCGDTVGMSWYITEDNYGMFDGRWMIDKSGLTELNSKITRSHMGKQVFVRTPMLCKLKPPSYCAKCAGQSIAMLPKSVHITASNINSTYMNVTMKSMHGKSLTTKEYDIFSSNK